LQKQNGQGFDFDGGGGAAAAVFRTLHTVYCEFYFSGVCVDHWEQKEDPGYQVGGAASHAAPKTLSCTVLGRAGEAN
jgi:hypothetical protein